MLRKRRGSLMLMAVVILILSYGLLLLPYLSLCLESLDFSEFSDIPFGDSSHYY